MVSVITPVFNAGAGLARAFESVKQQSIGFENIEYILVDDCSDDGSAQRIDEYAALHPNVVALHMERNSGTAGAPRNRALNIASAPYIMFLDNDDILLPNACATLYAHITKEDADIVSGDCTSVLSATNKKATGKIQSIKHASPGIYAFEQFDETLCKLFCYNFWTKIYKKALISQYNIRFSEGLMWEDVIFLFGYLSVCGKGRIIHDTILQYTIRDSSLSNQHTTFYYTTIPQSIMQGVEAAQKIGREKQYANMLENTYIVDFYVDQLLSETAFDRDKMSVFLCAWKDVLAYAYEEKFRLHSAYAQILARDMAECSTEKTLYDYFALRELYGQRKQELENIFQSNTWKLLTKLRHLFHEK